MGENLLAVDVQCFFLLAAHQVNVELGDARVKELLESAPVLFHSPDYAEAINNLVRYKRGVVASHFGMMMVIVAFAVFDVSGELRRELLGLVTRNQVHHMVGDEGGEPAHAVSSQGDVFRDPDGGRAHDLYLRELPSRFLSAFPHEA